MAPKPQVSDKTSIILLGAVQTPITLSKGQSLKPFLYSMEELW